MGATTGPYASPGPTTGPYAWPWHYPSGGLFEKTGLPVITCGGCGFNRSEHRTDGHCPGGDPGDTFTEQERRDGQA